jgi:hypothetical protein
MVVHKVMWHPNPDLLQVVSVDEDRNLIVFDYILNKVIGHCESAGKNFCFTNKGTNIVTTCDQ